MRTVQKRWDQTSLYTRNPSLGVFFCLFFFGSNSAQWFVFVCVYQAKQKMWNNYAKAEMQLLLCCLRPDQRCKKYSFIPSLFFKFDLFTGEHNLPMQWFPRQFHMFHRRYHWFQKMSGWICLPCEKLSSTSLTLYDALVLRRELEHWIFSSTAADWYSNWNVNAYFWKNSFYFSGSGSWDCQEKQ